jgi:hypothetical protein
MGRRRWVVVDWARLRRSIEFLLMASPHSPAEIESQHDEADIADSSDDDPHDASSSQRRIFIVIVAIRSVVWAISVDVAAVISTVIVVAGHPQNFLKSNNKRELKKSKLRERNHF